MRAYGLRWRHQIAPVARASSRANPPTAIWSGDRIAGWAGSSVEAALAAADAGAAVAGAAGAGAGGAAG